MAFGILEDTKVEHVPGTALLDRLDGGASSGCYDDVDPALLKREAGTDTVLVCRP
jgi:hypothetical protein